MENPVVGPFAADRIGEAHVVETLPLAVGPELTPRGDLARAATAV